MLDNSMPQQEGIFAVTGPFTVQGKDGGPLMIGESDGARARLLVGQGSQQVALPDANPASDGGDQACVVRQNGLGSSLGIGLPGLGVGS